MLKLCVFDPFLRVLAGFQRSFADLLSLIVQMVDLLAEESSGSGACDDAGGLISVVQSDLLADVRLIHILFNIQKTAIILTRRVFT